MPSSGKPTTPPSSAASNIPTPRNLITHRTPIDFTLRARVGEHLQLTAATNTHTASTTWTEKPLKRATKFPLTETIAKDQLSRLGDTPFELRSLTLDTDHQSMVPKSILNNLRRELIQKLLTQQDRAHKIENPNALETLRAELPPFIVHNSSFIVSLHILVRTLDQLTAVLAHNSPLKPTTIYADFEDVRRYPEAIAKCRDAKIQIALATLRIVKPGEEGFLKQVSDCNPDALLVRCLGAIRLLPPPRPAPPPHRRLRPQHRQRTHRQNLH